MTADQAIGALTKFASEQGRVATIGKTAKGVRGSFESVIHVEWSDSGSPVQAWVNTSDQRNSFGVYLRRRNPVISYGPKPFTGDRSKVQQITPET